MVEEFLALLYTSQNDPSQAAKDIKAFIDRCLQTEEVDFNLKCKVFSTLIDSSERKGNNKVNSFRNAVNYGGYWIEEILILNKTIKGESNYTVRAHSTTTID